MGICGVDCNACKLEEHCGGCSLCEASICKRYCGYCEAVCPNRYNDTSYCNSMLNNINFDFKLCSNEKIDIPNFVPGISDKIKMELPFIAVDGDSYLNSNGRHVTKRFVNGYKFAVGTNVDTKVLLHFYIKDKKLNGFWNNRYELYKSLRDFDAVISPNFSVYEDAPRMDHMYNIIRSVTTYNEMIRYGIKAIPDISYYNLNDLDKWCKEINNSKVNTVSFSFQIVDVRLRASNNWKNNIAAFRYLCKNINRKLKIIIIGISSLSRYRFIKEASLGHKLILVSHSPYIQSRRGILSDGGIKNLSLDINEILEKNLFYYKTMCDE